MIFTTFLSCSRLWNIPSGKAIELVASRRVFQWPASGQYGYPKTILTPPGYVGKNIFTPERWIPVIDALEIKLESEVRHRAQIMNENVNNSLDLFHTEIESFRRQ
jgi:hypothetical protein